MSMTREETITNLEKLAALFYTESEQSKMVDYSKIIEALEFAIAALRPVSREQVEKVERMRGEWVKPHWRNSTSCAVCSQCGFEAYHHEYHGVQDTYLFCPSCGAPMTDEAVQMVMERLEALHETT